MTQASAAPKRLSDGEFVAIVAMLFATIAFSLDAMLPALGQIADELSPEAPNRAQLVISSFVLGMGIGTFFTGPLSDSFGRRPVIFVSTVLYIGAAFVAWAATSLEMLLAARLVQGFGCAGPRVVSLAIVRDLYESRKMARIMSFAFLIFSIVPAFAPTIGAGIMLLTSWRGIFLAFVVFVVFAVGWLALRQQETLAPEHRRPFRPRALWEGLKEVLADRTVRFSIAVQTLGFGMLFGALSSTQPIFSQTFDREDSFPLWFGLIALIASSASLVNAALVERMGMRFMIKLAFAVQIGLSAIMVTLFTLDLLSPDWAFAAFVFWTTSLFFQAGLTLGNVNALAMEHMGHLAGTTASVVGALATVFAVAIAAPIGLAFDGTPRPLAWGALACAILAYFLMRRLGNAQR